MSFESEFLIGRFRARGTRLVLPTLFLGIAAFVLSFGYGRTSADWQLWLLYGVTGALALFGFLVPVVRYLTAWTDITTARLVTRSGIWGQHYQSVSLADIERVEYALGVVSVFFTDGQSLNLNRLPKPKLIAQELSNLVARTKAKEIL